jgi:tetratricopeptide (TPR) repeat protein
MFSKISKLLEMPIFSIFLSLFVLAIFYTVIFLIPNDLIFSQENSLKLSPEKSRELLTLSKNYLANKKYLEALDLTKQLVKSYPNNHIYLDQLASIYKELKEYQKEAETLEKFLVVAPIPSTACADLQEAYKKQNKIKEMIDICTRCLALEPQNGDLLFYLARSYELDKQYDKARETYEIGRKQDPNYLDHSVGIARVNFYQNDIKQAEDLLNFVLVKNPKFVDALLLIGLIEHKKGNNSKAKSYLEEGILITPNYMDFYFVLVNIAEQEKDTALAIKYCEQALKIDPNNEEIKKKFYDLSSK